MLHTFELNTAVWIYLIVKYKPSDHHIKKREKSNENKCWFMIPFHSFQVKNNTQNKHKEIKNGCDRTYKGLNIGLQQRPRKSQMSKILKVTQMFIWKKFIQQHSFHILAVEAFIDDWNSSTISSNLKVSTVKYKTQLLFWTS